MGEQKKKKMLTQDLSYTAKMQTCKMTWVEDDAKMWGGEPPTIALKWDNRIRFILEVKLQWNIHRLPHEAGVIRKMWEDQLVSEGVIKEEDTIDYKREHKEEVEKVEAPAII